MRKFQTISCVLALLVSAGSTSAQAQDRVAVTGAAADGRAELRALLEIAKEHAPEVSIARASLTSSRSALANGRLAPFGNPYLEVMADHGNKGVTKDVNVLGTLWLPVELSGQRGSRGREAEDFVSLHAALVGQARAQAAGRLVRAYGSSAVATERAVVLGELLSSAKAEAEMIAERVKNGDAIARDAAMAAVEAARHEVMLAEAEADLLRARGELTEVLGRPAPSVTPPVTPPALRLADLRTFKAEQLPQSRSLAAEARFYNSSAERWRKEGQSALSVGLVAGRGDLGETRLGGGLAYAFPVFRANRPERARALAESSRALAEQRVQQTVAGQRLKLLAEQQAQLARAVSTLTQTALPAAELAVTAVQETYRAGKAEVLAVLLSRRELSALSLRRLELLEQGWLLVSEYVEITGELP